MQCPYQQLSAEGLGRLGKGDSRLRLSDPSTLPFSIREKPHREWPSLSFLHRCLYGNMHPVGKRSRWQKPAVSPCLALCSLVGSTWHSGGGTGVPDRPELGLMLQILRERMAPGSGVEGFWAYDPGLGGGAGDPDCSLKSLLAGVKFAARGCGMETACHTKLRNPGALRRSFVHHQEDQAVFEPQASGKPERG